MTSATTDRINNLDEFYAYVQEHGKLRTADHAKRWTAGTLQILGVNVSGGTKKALANDLEEELSKELKQVFWPVFFRNTNLSSYDFCNRVARRSRGTSDPDFAKFPVAAVFGALKKVVGQDVEDKVKDDLSPELAAIWEKA